MHIYEHEQRIPQQVTAENESTDLRDSSLYGASARFETPCIPAQDKLCSAEQRHYVAGLRNIPFDLELRRANMRWGPTEADVRSGYDSETLIVSESTVDVVPHLN